MRAFVLGCLGILCFAALAGCSGKDTPADVSGIDDPSSSRAPGLPPAETPSVQPGQPTTLTPGNQDDPVVAAPPPMTLDPTLAGALAFTTMDYDFGTYQASDGDQPFLAYLRGEVTFPEGDGPFPLVLLMHGRHSTCDTPLGERILPVTCPDAIVVYPVPSYTGYRYLAENLASHGYVVASIDANDANSNDQGCAYVTCLGSFGDYGATARADMALRTLDMFDSLNRTGSAGSPQANPFEELQGRIDMSRIGFMGHSRGGEGTIRAITLNADRAAPHELKAVFAFAPTDFERWSVGSVPYATLLPYCDGDVYNLQGSWAYDDARYEDGSGPLYQVVARGANHNFFNSVWTGDDWGTGGDPWCGSEEAASGRDSGDAQRLVGLAAMASFLRMHVGGEEGFLPYWTGEAAWPASACPGVSSCADRMLSSYHPTSDQRTVMSEDGNAGSQDVCAPADCELATMGAARRVQLPEGGATLSFELPDGVDASGVLTLRVATGSDDVALEVTLGGSDPVTVSAPALKGAPGDDAYKAMLSTVRIPLSALGDVGGAGSVQIRFGGGAAQVADVMILGGP